MLKMPAFEGYRSQFAPSSRLHFSPTLRILTSHETFIHSFHVSGLPRSHTPEARRDEGGGRREFAVEATVARPHPLKKTGP